MFGKKEVSVEVGDCFVEPLAGKNVFSGRSALPRRRLPSFCVDLGGNGNYPVQ